VNAALGLLLALPAAGSFVLALLRRLGGMPVTDTLVAPVEKLIVRDIVGLDVFLHLPERPVRKRVDLEKTCLVDLDDVEFATLATLAPSPSCQDSVDLELPVGPLSWFDLGRPVIEFVILLPQAFAISLRELFSGLNSFRFIDMYIDKRVLLPYTFEEGKGFREVVKSVEEDQIDHLWPGDLELREHVEGDQPSQTEGRRLEQVRESGDAPSQDVLRVEELQLSIDELQVVFGEVDLGQGSIAATTARVRTDVAGFGVFVG